MFPNTIKKTMKTNRQTYPSLASSNLVSRSSKKQPWDLDMLFSVKSNVVAPCEAPALLRLFSDTVSSFASHLYHHVPRWAGSQHGASVISPENNHQIWSSALSPRTISGLCNKLKAPESLTSSPVFEQPHQQMARLPLLHPSLNTCCLAAL